MKGAHWLLIGVFVVVGELCKGELFALTPEEIYATASTAVVFVAGFSEEGQQGGTGSIVRDDGLVLTNAHVVIDKVTGQPYSRLFAYLKPARVTGDQKTDLSQRMRVVVSAYDEALDVALLQIENPPSDLAVIPIGNSDRVQIGAKVVAIGHPEQGGLWTLTTGVISAEFENFRKIPGKHVFQTETGLNRGNSGGPLLDVSGRMIGVNTAIARLAADGMPITGINFSLKARVVHRWLETQHQTLAIASDSVIPKSQVNSMLQKQQQTVVTPPKSQVNSMLQKQQQTVVTPPSVDVPPAKSPSRSYNLDSLLRTLRDTEVEMDDLIQEMRGKIYGK